MRRLCLVALMICAVVGCGATPGPSATAKSAVATTSRPTPPASPSPSLTPTTPACETVPLADQAVDFSAPMLLAAVKTDDDATLLAAGKIARAATGLQYTVTRVCPMETPGNSLNRKTLCDAARDYLKMGGSVPARMEAESAADDAQLASQEDRDAYKAALEAVGDPLSEGAIRLEVGYCDDL